MVLAEGTGWIAAMRKMMRTAIIVVFLACGWGQATAQGRDPVPGQPLFSVSGALVYSTPDHRLIWISFSPDPPHRLTRIILPEEGTILFNALDITGHRRMDQLRFRRGMTMSEVVAAWGPPDGLGGSGLMIWFYRLADGRTAWVGSDGVHVLYISARDQDPAPPPDQANRP